MVAGGLGRRENDLFSPTMPLSVVKRATSGGSLKSAGGSTASLDRVASYGSDSNAYTSTYENEYFPTSAYDGVETSEELLRAVAMTSAERSALVLQMLDVVSSDVQTMTALSSIADLTALTKHFGLCDVSVGSKVLEGMTKMINSTSPSREAGLLLFKCLLLRVGRRMEPFCIPLLPKVLSMVADRIQAVRELAQSISNEMTLLMNPYSFRTLLPILLKAMNDEDWRVKVVALSFLKQISPRVSRQVSPLLPEIIPAVTECIISTKPQVQQAGLDTAKANIDKLIAGDTKGVLESDGNQFSEYASATAGRAGAAIPKGIGNGSEGGTGGSVGWVGSTSGGLAGRGGGLGKTGPTGAYLDKTDWNGQLDMINPNTGKSLTIWERATRRYMGTPDGQRGYTMARIESLRKKSTQTIAAEAEKPKKKAVAKQEEAPAYVPVVMSPKEFSKH